MGDIGSGGGGGGAMAVCENPDPASISRENWGLAEEITREVVSGVHPTMDTDERRSNVIDYIQRLLQTTLGLEVFSYGSVPLKTYLPDGDIDLTILSSGPGAEASWATDVLSVLQWEEMNAYAEFKVKDTQFIDAEVKLVKCIIQNIVIDISFNQFGGICTLCFLEQVDRIVARDHLFKRSIILIKAWCYYESRILGAHHGLLSTYALETLVLYIFQLFTSSLDGPLSVLYKFLDYFSKFDWENFCISLNGPVAKSSLLEFVGPKAEQEEDHLMLSGEFLRNCIELFAMTPLGQETNSRTFTPKHINIIDPLRVYNNLGRSVHKGNFYRIRSAFRYGARKLGKVLTLPRDEIAKELKNFFSDIIHRHESKCESLAQDYAPALNVGGPVTFLSQQPTVISEDYMPPIPSGTESEYDPRLLEEKHSTYYSGLYSARYSSSLPMPGYNYSGHRFDGNASDIARYSYLDVRTSTTTSECSPSSNPSMSSLGQYGHVPLISLTNSSSRNAYSSHIDSWDYVEEKTGLDTWLESRDERNMEMANTSHSCSDSLDDYSPCSSVLSSPKSNILEDLSLDFREIDFGSEDDSEPLNPLADLTGDYDSHIRSLLHGPFFHKFDLLESVLQHTLSAPLQFESNQPWVSVPQSMPSEQPTYGQMYQSNVSITQPQSLPLEQPSYGQMYQSNVSITQPQSMPSEQLTYGQIYQSNVSIAQPQPMPSEQPAYGQMYQSNVSIAQPQPMPSEQPAYGQMYQSKVSIAQPQSMPLDQPTYGQMYQSSVSVVVPGSSAFSSEDKQKARGTGTYFPNMNNYSREHDFAQNNDVPYIPYVPLQQLNRSSSSSASSWMHGQPQRHSSVNNYNSSFSEISNYSPRGSSISEINNSPKGILENLPNHVRKKSAVSCQSPRSKECQSRANSLQNIEFGSIGNLVDEVISASHSSCAMASKKHLNASSSSVSIAEAKVAAEPFILKNEEEFPPLSV